ncbi:MAG TPA: cytochrome P450, partial [Acidimicrobiales bacterium]|nr:cytochrome P450 [Acidimicrobiales bacterium]
MTVTSADVYFDMYDRDLYASPYAMYRRMRDEAPVYRNEQYNFWALTRFDDVAKILTDRDTFSSAKGGVYQIAS